MDARAKDDGSMFYLLGKRLERKHAAHMDRKQLYDALRHENPSLRDKSDEYISQLIDNLR
ncbi:MAG: hypothetical protein ABI361_12690 [Nitrososphaera sp.]